MKSINFKNLAKGLVVVSAALALANCGDATDKVNSAISDAQDQYLTDQGQGTANPAQDPATDPAQQGTEPSLSQDPADPAADPGQNVTDPTTDPAQQGTELGQQTDPGTDPVIDPTDSESSSSSEVTGPNNPAQSSSSEAVIPASSSSEEQKAESSSSEAKAEGGIFLAEGTDENKDQMEITYIENIEPCIWDGQNNRNLCKILAYPKRLSSDKKHAVVMWGPGGGSDPKDYGGIIKRLASHGFVVVAIPQSPGDATQGKPALDWLESKNNDPSDPLYNKLDMTKVGCSGHSMGGLESEQMVIKDNRVITAMLNNSGDLGHTAMSQVSPNKTIGVVYGEGGMERPNAEADYNNQGVRAPACLLKMTGGQGTECQMGECGWGHGSGPWGGMAATVAWMRWHLGGEDFRKADFVGSTGKYIDGAIIGQPGKWKGQCKNF
ncbi:alpha/beta hydrolase [Fibrobacter sp.]|uniref:poly(ethylene terephthalate) hydrolase family protein n=1 Tax=Fibrobacter sp. TaxID=35828 RepID=UPI0038708AA2